MKLTAKARHGLDNTEFALPGRRYPIEDKNHARNALARAAQHATPQEQATIKRKVSARYPSIEIGGKPTKKYANGGNVTSGDRQSETEISHYPRGGRVRSPHHPVRGPGKPKPQVTPVNPPQVLAAPKIKNSLGDSDNSEQEGTAIPSDSGGYEAYRKGGKVC